MLREAARLAVTTAIECSRVETPQIETATETITFDAGAIGQLTTETSEPAGRTVQRVIAEATTLIVFAEPLGEVLPVVGDRVRFYDGRDREFIVTEFEGEPAYRWCDPFHIGIRIHCKEV